MVRITDTLHGDLCTFMIPCRVIILIKINASDKSSRENQNIRFVVNKFFPKIMPFVRQFGKDGGAREATDENIIRRILFAGCITGYKHPFRTCDTYCFSMVKFVTRQRLNATLYSHGASFSSGLGKLWVVTVILNPV